MNVEEFLIRCNLEEKVHGRDEFEMYRNYIKDVPQANLLFFVHESFKSKHMEVKSDSKAAEIRNLGNRAYKFNNCQESLKLYIKSLCYASYDSKEYALALANRSAVFFALEDYTSCLQDLNLCLKSNYPDDLKPKVYIRKAKCYQKLGEVGKMRNTLMDTLNFIDDCSALSKTVAEKYRRTVQTCILDAVDKKPVDEERFDVLPDMEMNPTFLNASSSVALKYVKRKGCHVVAKKNIALGDVLFVEKAFAWSSEGAEIAMENLLRFCQYCLAKLTSSVPCKKCVKRSYCDEKCRDAAWNEFHQWECLSIQADFFTHNVNEFLPLVMILKAAHSGLLLHKKSYDELTANYGNKDDNYPYVYNLKSNVEKLKKGLLMEHAMVAALWVNYLKLKTNFFTYIKKLPAYANRSERELMNKVGGLMIKHRLQLICNVIPIRVCNYNLVGPNKEFSIAGAICPSVCMMNHACMPNTTYYFIGDVMVVKALQDIKVNEEIFHAHLGLPYNQLPKEVREDVLKNLTVKCSCRLCIDPRISSEAADSYLCIRCKGPAPLLDSDNPFDSNVYKCLDCQHIFTLSYEAIAKEKMAIAFLNKFAIFGDINDANHSLSCMKSIFRPNHMMFGNLYVHLKKYYKSEGNLKCYLNIAKMLIEFGRQRQDEFSVRKGIVCSLMAIDGVEILSGTVTKINLEDFGEALHTLEQFVKEAKESFHVCNPQFIRHLQKVEKSIFELRVLHTLRIADKKRRNSGF